MPLPSALPICPSAFRLPFVASGAGVLAAALLLVAGPAHGQIPINLASSNGNASTQTSAYGITPSAGMQQFLLTTINPAASLPQDGSLGTTPANTNVTSLNSYFGLPSGVLAGQGAQDGSGYLSQQVTLTLGTRVSFDFVFLTDEDNTTAHNNDFAFFTINGAQRTIYNAGQATGLSNAANFDLQSVGGLTSGYSRFTYTVPVTGNYTFGFGVVDVTTNTVYSGLIIDNFNYSLVPEPGSVVCLALGGITVAAAVVRRRATAKLPPVA